MQESSINDLYRSAVAAFPGTTRRQHATDPVVITEIRWTPFLGMKTLLVRGLAQNEDREYNTTVLFKGVRYVEQKEKGLVPLNANDGKTYFLEQLSLDHDVVLRCNCPDFYWRFNYFDHVDKSLYGRKRAKYEAKHNPGSANPMKMPGMCKHLMKLSKALVESGLVKNFN